jgi:membrane associated rhomboid family serine protease
MLDDRSYMRDQSHYGARSATMTLIVVLIVAFVGQSILQFYFNFVSDHLALTVDGIRRGQVWQLVTFQFLHATPWPWHVLGNCLGLYFFGTAVEEALGSPRFLKLYFGAGLAGGLTQVLTTAVLPHHLDVPVVGASAGVLGMLSIFAMMFPEKDTMMFLYFIPIRIKAKYIFWFFFLLSLYGTIIPYGPVAYAAHLGGMTFGYAYVRWILNSDRAMTVWQPFRRERPQREIASPTPRRAWRKPRRKAEDVTPAEFISKEVDPILEKISAHGIHSLTERERAILEAARSKMAKR